MPEWRDRNRKYMIFDSSWFKQHQKTLLFLLNTPVLKYWGRWIFRISLRDYPANVKITELGENYLTLKDRLFIENGKLKSERKYHFFTHNLFSERVYHAFYPVWFCMHWWDMLFANRFAPQLNLGFDTFYPDAHPESTSADGTATSYSPTGAGFDWAALIGGQGGSNTLTADTSSASANPIFIGTGAYAGTNKWTQCNRGLFNFNTSSLNDDATISSVEFSLYGNDKADGLGVAPNINVYASNSASNTNFVGADFNSFGSTAFCDTPITYSGWATNGRNSFTLNSTGVAAISKTGITKLGIRNANYDVSGTTPTYTYNRSSYLSCYFADYGDTTYEPKLVVTATVTATKTVTETTRGRIKKAGLFNLETIRARIKSVLNKKITARGRIKNTVSTNKETTRGRIKLVGKTNKETIRARIKTAGLLKLETTRARVKLATTKKETAKARIKLITAKKETIKARVKRAGLSNKETIRGRVKRAGLFNKETNKARIKQTGLNSVTPRGRLKKQGVNNAITSKGRIGVTESNKETTRGRIKQSPINKITSTGRIQKTETTKVETSRGRVKQTKQVYL